MLVKQGVLLVALVWAIVQTLVGSMPCIWMPLQGCPLWIKTSVLRAEHV